ncbi:glucosamine-6-phosphate deaminase [Puia sp.]|uniref:glucosamine-6-phosphate deaminase n=1 Tax=Puia sp. TaxID=2045100 RepID=UPI002F414FAC
MQSDSIRDSHNLGVHIFDSRTDLGEAAAAATAITIRTLLTTRETVNIVFAAAPSQNEFLAALNRQPLDWDRINAFHMDEYLGLGPEAPQSFGYYLKRHIFDKHPFRSVNLMNGLAADPEAECRRYTALLQAHPTDIVCLGIGENNHLAFNDPPVADFRDPQTVKIVTLDADCRRQQVNDGCFPTLAAVPLQALTITIPALMAGRYLFSMVPGERKARAVANTFDQPVTERYPSTILKQHPAVQLFLDRDSSKLLST